ncbi:helix-turn-helix transcriptional regulator [Taibaiella soli]|uniref:HTH araC/xylS-type domain-containing protein n=1 Tax=Taibaiella soli TaxID=1649169 RepID=A0A2W2BEC0_9BACT|nr:AraC family transcriptional regulator [Taibaiella soli]PZF74609.1 hypothetical protein DN068_03260 [Taibaiella soli]
MTNISPVRLTVDNPDAFLTDLAKEIKEKWKGQVHYSNDLLKIKNDVWDGELRNFSVDKGLSITLVNLSIKQPCQVFHDLGEGELYYHFYFDRALGQRLHVNDKGNDITPIGLMEKNSYIVMSSNTMAHTDMPVCQLDNIILHMSRKFFTDNVPVDNLKVDAATWKRLFGTKPLVLYGTCNDKILKLTDDLSRIDITDYALAIYLKGIVMQLIAQVLQIEIGKHAGEITGVSNLKDVRALLDINFRIEQQFDEPLPTIETVAAEAHMSATKFKDFFKKTFGVSYYTYYKQRRMDKARELLLTKKYSVAEVASMVGFLNSGKFTKQFQNTFNVLPKDILKTADDDTNWHLIDAVVKDRHFRIKFQ